MVEKVTTNLDSLKVFGPDKCQDCHPELLLILAEHMWLKKSCFLDCWKVLSMVPVFKDAGKSSTAKNCCPVSHFSVICKAFKKLLNNKFVDHLEKCGRSVGFQYRFRSSGSTVSLLIAVSDRNAWAFDRSVVT